MSTNELDDNESIEHRVDLRAGAVRVWTTSTSTAVRVAFALAVEPTDVPGKLGGDHLDGERVTVPVAGGVLVYEQRAVGKELVGFENVDDWDALADALAARGHDPGGGGVPPAGTRHVAIRHPASNYRVDSATGTDSMFRTRVPVKNMRSVSFLLVRCAVVVAILINSGSKKFLLTPAYSR